MKVLLNEAGRPHVFTIVDLSKALERSISSIWGRVRIFSTLPAPEIRVGRREYYSAHAFDEIVKTERARRASREIVRRNDGQPSWPSSEPVQESVVS